MIEDTTPDSTSHNCIGCTTTGFPLIEHVCLYTGCVNRQNITYLESVESVDREDKGNTPTHCSIYIYIYIYMYMYIYIEEKTYIYIYIYIYDHGYFTTLLKPPQKGLRTATTERFAEFSILHSGM